MTKNTIFFKIVSLEERSGQYQSTVSDLVIFLKYIVEALALKQFLKVKLPSLHSTA